MKTIRVTGARSVYGLHSAEEVLRKDQVSIYLSSSTSMKVNCRITGIPYVYNLTGLPYAPAILESSPVRLTNVSVFLLYKP